MFVIVLTASSNTTWPIQHKQPLYPAEIPGVYLTSDFPVEMTAKIRFFLYTSQKKKKKKKLTHLIRWYANDTCWSPLFPQLPLLDLSFPLPGARAAAVLLLRLAGWRALLVAVVARHGAGGVRRGARSFLRLRRSFLQVGSGRSGVVVLVVEVVLVVRFLLRSLQSWAGGGPSHRVGGGEAVPSWDAPVRVVGLLGARWRSSSSGGGVAVCAVCVAGTHGSTGGCGDVPQHFGSHFLPFCLPLLQKVCRGVWLKPSRSHDPFHKSLKLI